MTITPDFTTGGIAALIVTGIGMIITMVKGQRQQATDNQKLTSDVGDMKSDVVDIKYDQKRMGTDLNDLKVAAATTNAGMDNLKSAVGDLNARVREIEKTRGH